MRQDDLVRQMLAARVKYYRTVTYCLLFLVSVCVLALAGTIYLPTHSEPEVTTLFISLVSGLFGSLLTIVTQGIQAARRLRSDEELQAGAEQISFDRLKAEGKVPADAELPPPSQILPNVKIMENDE